MQRIISTLLVVSIVALPGCGRSKKKDTSSTRGGPVTATTAPNKITLSSADVTQGGDLPAAVTCDGAGTPPALAWSGVPKGTAELVLVVQDPDAKPRTFLHWAVLGLDASRTELPRGFVPAGGRQVENGAGKTGYAPPCPPKGDPAHHYQFVLYALKAPEGVKQGGSLDDVRAALKDKVLAQGELVATYRR
jgi:Raf kinase inhibitor-like YbhB/YbcL family protein